MKYGDIQNIRSFYEAHRQALYTYALSLTGSREAAEDVIHDAITAVLGLKRPPNEMKPYVFRCIRNAAMDAHRRTSKESAHETIFQTQRTPDPSLGLIAEEMLDQLSPDEREAVVLKVYSGMTFLEIAEVRGVSVNTAASWYRRGLEKMRVENKEEKHG
jgi:RNA polymerase sigma-70 factor (ECF subfamily)